jgi:hypothetical protein
MWIDRPRLAASVSPLRWLAFCVAAFLALIPVAQAWCQIEGSDHGQRASTTVVVSGVDRHQHELCCDPLPQALAANHDQVAAAAPSPQAHLPAPAAPAAAGFPAPRAFARMTTFVDASLPPAPLYRRFKRLLI